MNPSAMITGSSPAAAVVPRPGQPLPRSDLLGQVVPVRELERRPLLGGDWLWHGYLGRGKVTLLTSQWKSGKTTLVALLLARMQRGGQLAGLAVAPGSALVISEESEIDWRPRCRQMGIQDGVDLLCRPFGGQPRMDQWHGLIETALTLHDRQGTDLVVFDTLPYFLPANSENSASGLLECLTPLERLTAAGMGVLLIHHPRKGKTQPGQAARGSGALSGYVHILLEMALNCPGDDSDRRRRLLAFSRCHETRRHVLMELQADDSDYLVVPTGPEAILGENFHALEKVLMHAYVKLTRFQILEAWPKGYTRPDASTLWRWLGQAAARGVVCKEGTGRPKDPYRFWVPEREHMLYPTYGTDSEISKWHSLYLLERGGWTPEVGEAVARAMAVPAPAEITAAPPASPGQVLPPAQPVPAETHDEREDPRCLHGTTDYTENKKQ